MKQTGNQKEKRQTMVDMVRWIVTELVHDRSSDAKGNRFNSSNRRRRLRV